MIYSVLVKNDLNKDKQFYITADDENKAIRRMSDTYRISRDRISILKVFEEVGLDNYKLLKSYEKKLSKDDKDIIEKAKIIFSKNTKKGEPWKSDYINKHNFNEVEIDDEKDLYDLVKNYKTVKVYWELSDKRGIHKYYALYK